MENAVDPDPALEHRTEHHRQDEGHAHAGAEDRHGGGAHFGARGVGHQGRYRGGDRAGALHGAAEHDPVDVVGAAGDEAAEREQQHAGHDHPLAAPAVRGDAERDLQDGLHQAI